MRRRVWLLLRSCPHGGGAEPLMVRVVENGGRALGAEMGELKNVKE
jgi:hypothetical protein